MNRTSVGLLAVIAFFISACNPEPGLPNPGGKASVRAINAIPASPAVTFAIEEPSYRLNRLQEFLDDRALR